MTAPDSTRKTMLALVATALAVGALLGATGATVSWVPALVALARGEFPFFGLAFFGVALASLLLAPRAHRARLALVMVTVEFALAIARRASQLPVAGGGFGAGLVGFSWLALTRNTGALVDLLILSLFPAYAEVPLALTERLRPMVLDGFVAHAELGFGFDFARQLALVTNDHAVMWQLLNTIYLLLLPALMTTYALHARRWPERAHETMVSFAVAGALGFCCYLVFPVVGPDPSIAGYPFDAGGESLPAAWFHGGSGARNCMPSLHTAWALIIFFRTHGLPRVVRTGAAFFTTGTLLATLGLSHHYLLDLVVAAPFAATADGLASAGAPGSTERRLRLAALGAALVIGWLVLLSWCWWLLEQQGWLLWLLTASTLTVTLWLRRAWVAFAAAPTHTPTRPRSPGPT